MYHMIAAFLNHKLERTVNQGDSRELVRKQVFRMMGHFASAHNARSPEAVAFLEPITFTSGHTDLINLWAVAKIQAGDLPAAVKALTFLNSPEARISLSGAAAYGCATLARIQGQLGQKDEARKNYQKFFDLWKDADPDVPLLVKAREEFAKLGS